MLIFFMDINIYLNKNGITQISYLFDLVVGLVVVVTL